jgi:hypothetical protein
VALTEIAPASRDTLVALATATAHAGRQDGLGGAAALFLLNRTALPLSARRDQYGVGAEYVAWSLQEPPAHFSMRQVAPAWHPMLQLPLGQS